VRTGEDAPDPGPIVAAAERAGVPLRVQSIDAPELAALLEHRLVLVRPDGHVAWRGNAPPSDAEAMIARVRGASVATAVGESVVS
jgi:hypothetical protein